VSTIDDPTADEGWNAGCDFAMMQLCKFLGVDPEKVTWDAATETVEGDVQAVIGNILRMKFGDDWSPSAAPTQGSERELADLVAAYYRRDIGITMHQAEHWAKENYPLAVHHRVRSADECYQIVCLFERFATFGENPFAKMRQELTRSTVYPPGKYPPTAEIHAYRDPAFVVEKLKTAPKAAGGPG
jgi:hypothetical protein